MLQGALLLSPHTHAEIAGIDVSAAQALPGVAAVLTGQDCSENLGIYTGDKPPLARNRVRHWGEAVAAVAADCLETARRGAALIRVDYRPLEAVLDPREARKKEAPLVHPDLAAYGCADFIYPEPGTNMANHTKIRKGDLKEGFRRAAVTVELTCSLPLGDHGAMEPRGAVARIDAGGEVDIWSSTQAPFVVRAQMATVFGISPGKIRVHAPLVGGGFGGKAGIQLEGLAYLLSRKAGGRPVKLVNRREDDMASSPGRIGLSADIRLGAARDGSLTALECCYYFDTGAYGDYAVNVARAAAISCTGPYRVPVVHCDSYCLYTNKTFAAAFRGFGHIESSFVMERALEELAGRLGMDPLALRLKNAIRRGDTTPTGAELGEGTGDLAGCAEKAARGLNWDRGLRQVAPDGRITARALSFFWKAPAIPPNTDAGAVITFNEDGSVNVNTGIVDIGTGTQTSLGQIAAEVLDIPPQKIHVRSAVETGTSPHDWTTAASRSLMMAGLAVQEAAEDALEQIKAVAALPLGCDPSRLRVAGERVFPGDDPAAGLPLSAVVLGYTYPNGNAVGGQVIGRGRYITPGLTGIDRETGRGNPALEWTLGAQGVEVELDPATGIYRILTAAGCMDVGRVINPRFAREQMTGAMLMGIGYACREGFSFTGGGRLENGSLRDFKLPRYGEAPRFVVDFLETPQPDGPFGARGLGEQGIIGMPGAVANALSRAAGVPLNHLPLTPERIWQALEAKP